MTLATKHPHQPPALSQLERKLLHTIVSQTLKDYDPASRMLRSAFSSPGYHTTYTGSTVHETRQSLKFAVALLDTGAKANLKIATDILERVINLQDQNPENDTYGIWPWFLEESISKMNPPDWNWADFCGVQLLEARLTHSARLPKSLIIKIDDSLMHASHSIVNRNVSLNYTNILIMGSFVVLMTGELLDNVIFYNFASQRLERFYEYTMKQGAFAEYNSPPYTNVTLNELKRLQNYVTEPDLKSKIDTLYMFAWKEIAQYFHPHTGQWAGPHSRCYETILTPQIEGNIQRALDLQSSSDVITLDQHRLQHDCPQQFRQNFITTPGTADLPRTLTKLYSGSPAEIIGTTYFHPKFCLGSVNYSDLFNQRRSLLAYWGEPEHVRSLRLRFLHDGYDFTAMQYYSTQREGNILAALSLATDGGDRHPYFDRIVDGHFEASDLRLRLEIEGVSQKSLKTLNLDSSETSGYFSIDGIYLSLSVIEATFDGLNGKLEVTYNDGIANLDIVFYTGVPKAFSFDNNVGDSKKKKRVGIAFAAQLSPDDMKYPMENVQSYTHTSKHTRYRWQKLQLDVPTFPGLLETMPPLTQEKQ